MKIIKRIWWLLNLLVLCIFFIPHFLIACVNWLIYGKFKQPFKIKVNGWVHRFNDYLFDNLK